MAPLQPSQNGARKIEGVTTRAASGKREFSSAAKGLQLSPLVGNQGIIQESLRAPSERLLHAMVVGDQGLELEPLCGRPSPQAKP